MRPRGEYAMHPNLKIILALLLIVAAAGIVTYDIQFFGADEGDASLTEEFVEEPSSFDEEDAAAFPHQEKLPVPILRYPREAAAELSRGDPPELAEAADRPLGREWENTLWHELLEAYAERNSAEPPAQMPPSDPDPAPVDVDPVLKEALEKAAEAKADASLKRRLGPLKVQGILCGKTGATALINGRIYRTGDLLPEDADIRVAAIGKKYVVFRFEGNGFTAVKHLEPLGSTYRPPYENPENAWEEDHEAPPEPRDAPAPEEDEADTKEENR